MKKLLLVVCTILALAGMQSCKSASMKAIDSIPDAPTADARLAKCDSVVNVYGDKLTATEDALITVLYFATSQEMAQQGNPQATPAFEKAFELYKKANTLNAEEATKIYNQVQAGYADVLKNAFDQYEAAKVAQEAQPVQEEVVETEDVEEVVE